ncbi:MAG: hypothetical protein ACP5KM_06120, partial [Conexivisphaera sp.]
ATIERGRRTSFTESHLCVAKVHVVSASTTHVLYCYSHPARAWVARGLAIHLLTEGWLSRPPSAKYKGASASLSVGR